MVKNNFNSKNYWENRYKNNGNSGLGSYGYESEFKSKYINNFIRKNNIKTINDFGCGDSNQISTIDGFDTYMGFDVSTTAINLCVNKFKDDNRFKFVNNINDMIKSDVTFSLDVTYHIVEEIYFDEYMHNLFNLTNKYVLIYSINSDNSDGFAIHLKNRKFMDWIKKEHPNFQLIDNLPFDGKNNGIGFYLFEKI
jgi:hypothetical protein